MKKLLTIICTITIIMSMTTPAQAARLVTHQTIPIAVSSTESPSHYNHSIVFISVELIKQEGNIMYWERYTASGCFISNDMIITNAHPFFGENVGYQIYNVSYRFDNIDRDFDAKVLKIDASNDLCLLKATENDPQVRPVSLNISEDTLISSEKYFACGFPQSEYKLIPLTYDSKTSVTAHTGDYTYNQTNIYNFCTDFTKDDADKASGISGGAVLNKNGEIVGICGYSSLGHMYAIRVDQVNAFISEFKLKVVS